MFIKLHKTTTRSADAQYDSKKSSFLHKIQRHTPVYYSFYYQLEVSALK